MRIITRQVRANAAVARVREPTYYPTVDELERYQKIKALGDVPDPDEVERLCGKGSTLLPSCYECHTEVEALVELGDDSRFGLYPESMWVCRDCVVKAVSLFETM